jgi:hypothetical protein
VKGDEHEGDTRSLGCPTASYRPGTASIGTFVEALQFRIE